MSRNKPATARTPDVKMIWILIRDVPESPTRINICQWAHLRRAVKFCQETKLSPTIICHTLPCNQPQGRIKRYNVPWSKHRSTYMPIRVQCYAHCCLEIVYHISLLAQKAIRWSWTQPLRLPHKPSKASDVTYIHVTLIFPLVSPTSATETGNHPE